MPLSDEEFEKIKKLWAEAYLKLTEIGQMIGRHTKNFDEKIGMGSEVELTATIQRKDGSVRKTQEYVFKNNKLIKREIKEE